MTLFTLPQRLLFSLCVFVLVSGTLVLQASNERGPRFYPSNVDAYNAQTAIPAYFDVTVLHEKFTLTETLIRPRSHGPSWVRFDQVDFNKGYKYILTRYSVDSDMGRTFVEIRLNAPDEQGQLIGDFRVENTGGYAHFIDRAIPIEPVKGKHDLYIVFEHGGDYAFFELSNVLPDHIPVAEPADAYHEFVRPDFSLQQPIHHFDEPMPVSGELVDQALLQLSSGGRAGFHRGRLSENRDSRQAVAVLATSMSQGNDDIFVRHKLLEVLRGQRHSILNGPLRVKYLQDSALPYSLAMLWRHEDFMSELSDSERRNLLLFVQAMLIENAFMMADFTPDGHVRGAQRFQLNGLEAWTGGNPNYYERHSTSFMYAASILGDSETRRILANYNHREFLRKLRESPNPAINQALYNHFSEGFIRLIGRTRYDARTPELKGKLVESYIHGIQRLDEEGKPFYKGMTLDEMLSNPGLVQYVNFRDRTFGKRAMQGDYIGQWGMYHEFSTADGGDEALGASLYLRDDLDYALYSPRQPVYYNLFLRSSGAWEQLDEEKRTWIADRISIAMSDLQPKAGGYWSTNFRGSSFKKISDRPTYNFAEQLLANMGHVRARLFAENFERDAISITWTEHGNWIRREVDTWTGRPQHRLTGIAADTVIEAAPEGSHLLLSEYELKDFNLYVQAMPLQPGAGEAARFGLAGRFQNADNGYLMAYDVTAESLQIIRLQDGEPKILGETNYPIPSEKMIYMRGEFKGSELNLYINSQKLVSANCDAFESGSLGLHAENKKAQFDNILVTAAEYGDLGHLELEYFLDRLMGKGR